MQARRVIFRDLGYDFYKQALTDTWPQIEKDASKHEPAERDRILQNVRTRYKALGPDFETTV